MIAYIAGMFLLKNLKTWNFTWKRQREVLSKFYEIRNGESTVIYIS